MYSGPPIPIGKQFGRWTVIAEAEKTACRRRNVSCRCTCGKTKVVQLNNLRNGTSLSCGCLRGEQAAKRETIHGQASVKSETTEYRIWKGIITRCTNPNRPEYPRYGGRGIKVCDRWRTFANFFADMGRRPSKKHSLDRIDNDGDYQPSNCRWATASEQGLNTRRTIFLEHKGKRLSLAEWASLLNLSPYRLQRRFHAGWPVEKILANPTIPFPHWRNIRNGHSTIP